MQASLAPSIAAEFADADLGDQRLNRRLRTIAVAAEGNPSASLPEQAGSVAALEATYRFYSNGRVTPDAVFAPHQRATIRRALEETNVLVIHDTTEFRFGGEKERDGLGWINSSAQKGFLAHLTFCVAQNGRPLGTLGLHAWTRSGNVKGRRVRARSTYYGSDRESLRWQDAALAAGAALHGTSPIHVMDREGDQFELLSLLLDHGERFIIRMAHDRRLIAGRGKAESQYLFESMSSCRLHFEREIKLGPRGKSEGSNKDEVFPVRAGRMARVQVRAGTREIFRTHNGPAHTPASLTLQVVEVAEVNAPAGVVPVVWRIVTSESIDTNEQVATIVDSYRQRWQIEEFFKALKTGCSYERLQIENARGLLLALCVQLAVAWRLLLLRWATNHQPNAKATTVLEPQHLMLLRKLCLAETGRRMRSAPTVRTVLWELARLGGHVPNNGEPGWLVLRRGFQKLLAIERGWLLAHGPWRPAPSH